MKVLVDTPIWSLAFRKKTGNIDNIAIKNLIELIHDRRIAIIGPARQKVLYGIQGSHTDFLICAMAIKK